jgi:hypothetical protein
MGVRARLLVIGFLLFSLATLAVAFSHQRDYWGPFRGRVVDADTGEPVAGAVMLVVWTEAYGLGLLETRFHDAKEAVSDKDGRWEVPRLEDSRIRITVLWPEFHMFVPGYELKEDIVTPPSSDRVYLDDTVTTVRRIKTRAELVRKSRGRPSVVPADRLPETTAAVNRERAMLGYDPLPILRRGNP